MANSRAQTKRNLEEAASATAEPEPLPPAEDQVPGVAVLRVKSDQSGKEDIQIVPLGGMDPLAIPVLLKLALKLNQRHLGLEDE